MRERGSVRQTSAKFKPQWMSQAVALGGKERERERQLGSRQYAGYHGAMSNAVSRGESQQQSSSLTAPMVVDELDLQCFVY